MMHISQRPAKGQLSLREGLILLLYSHMGKNGPLQKPLKTAGLRCLLLFNALLPLWKTLSRCCLLAG